MKFTKIIVLGMLGILNLPSAVSAASTPSSWEAWLSQQINQHPDVVAAKEKMYAALSLADGREMPLYNPELETEFDREGQSNNYRIGVKQTFDLWGKRDVRQRQASYSRELARQSFEFTVQKKTAEALLSLIEWQAANQQASLAREQEAQLSTLIELINIRQKTGDLGLLDAELAYLNLSKNLSTTAKNLAQLKQIEATLRQQLPQWSPESEQIPEQLWVTKNSLSESPNNVISSIKDYPTVRAAKAEWDGLRQSAELARLETKAEPTFGISAGRVETDGSNVIGLTMSIPLNVRNNFRYEALSANQQVLSAEARYQAVMRKQQFSIQSSQSVLQEYSQRYDRWQTIMKGRQERSKNLLDKQWQSGDMNTSAYLLALQQRAEGLAAGIELQMQFQLANIDWLLQAGRINTALQQLQK